MPEVFEVREKFGGEVKVLREYPYDISHIDSEARSYLRPGERANYYFLVAEEKGRSVGFIVATVDNNNQAHTLFKYVDPEERRKSVGQHLSNKLYEWAAHMGVTEIHAGINDVLQIHADGSVHAVLSPKSHGGWPSYGSLTKSGVGGRKQKRSIKSVKIGKDGCISIDFVTILNTERDEPMPGTPEELLQALYNSGVLPKDVSTIELLRIAQNSSVFFKDGKQYSLREWTDYLKQQFLQTNTTL